MKVDVDRPNHTVHVIREDSDPKIYRESAFFHKVKVKMQEQGYDVIKKLAWKDGHMIDDSQHYIRERKGKWCVWYPEYALRFVYTDYNDEGKVDLQLVD